MVQCAPLHRVGVLPPLLYEKQLRFCSYTFSCLSMSNLSCIASVSIAKDTYIARLQQRMPVAIQALAATVAAFTSSSGPRRAAAKRSLD